MMIFKMNDIEHVAAESEEQAKKYYHNLTGEDMYDINEFFKGEVSIDGTMFVAVKELPTDELKETQEVIEAHDELWTKKTFGWFVENEKINSPCVICSTE